MRHEQSTLHKSRRSRLNPDPGRWKVEDQDDNGFWRVVDEQDVTIAVIPQQPPDPEERAEANARLIAEAGTVFYETGMTPAQMRAELRRLDDQLSAFIKSGS
jgi:hypothetical protein